MAPMTRLKPGAPCLRTANLARLDRLAEVLLRRGLEAKPLAPVCRVPRLVVSLPAGQPEEIYAWCCRDGDWWYWWPWAERIASDADLEQAAARIEQVLTKSLEA